MYKGLQWCLILAAVAHSRDHFERLMIIGIDGFGSYYMRNFTGELPNLSRLINNGYSSYEQRNQIPAVSAPNWATVLTGMPPSDTGIHDNDWSVADSNPASATSEGLPPLSGAGKAPPSVADVVRPSRSFGAAYSWKWFERLIPKDGTNMIVSCEYIDDECVTNTVLDWIKSGVFPDVSFVYFGTIDEMGHDHGWGSEEFYAAARDTDKKIGRILEALESHELLNSLLIAVTADHGGLGKEHGAFNQINMETPVIYSSLGARKVIQGVIPERHSNLRFLPTCLRAIDVAIPEYMSDAIDIFPITHEISIHTV